MSLLLDALKKAEKEKLKAHEAEAASTENEVQPSEELVIEDEPTIQSSSEDVGEKTAQENNDDIELMLDDDQADQEVLAAEDVELDMVSKSIELEKVSATTSTISDEALQLLVYKTNKKYRQRKKVIWGGLLSATAIILMLAGSYYYYGMLEEVDALERKHKLAMRSVRTEPIKQRQASEIVESIAAVEVQSPEPGPKKKQTAKKIETASVQATATKRKFSIKKTNTQDPINALLRNAWLAYNKADYLTAGRDYGKVLKREENNRDALLGVAAIAVKNTNYEKARASYRLLLKLDPRDQVAMAAIANINELSVGLHDESRLKFMLQQQPSASHLNFALGNLYAKKLQWPEAQAEYFKAWQGNSKNADYIYNLAVSLDQLGKTKEAIRFYKESLLFSRGKNISFSKSDVEKRIQQVLDK